MTDVAEIVYRGAVNAAEKAAIASGVQVRELRELAEFQCVVDLFDRIWHPAASNVPITHDLLRALCMAGNYVGGAFEGTSLVGACCGFFGPPGDAAMHSHVAGVSAEARGRHVGFALKLHQRGWALGRQVTRISWTFDPLVRRNAYFNLGKLAATAAEYAVNFYGPMRDAINGDDESDRLVVDWHLLSDPVARACEGLPPRVEPELWRERGAVTGLSEDSRGAPVVGETTGPLVLVAVPADVERLRRTDSAVARSWRLALRDVLGGLLGDGGRVVGFARAGWYVVDTRR